MMTRSLGRDARILGGAQGQIDPLASRYYNLIIGRIDRIWSPLARNSTRRLEAFYNIVIEPDGRLSSARRVRSSGDADFDRSVEQALRQSSPLPPPPSIFGGRRVTVPLVFNHDRGRP
jgi:TonB family protein